MRITKRIVPVVNDLHELDKATHTNAIAATIERCAQWLIEEAKAIRSQVSGGDGTEPQWIKAEALDRAAAAIRKLKENTSALVG